MLADRGEVRVRFRKLIEAVNLNRFLVFVFCIVITLQISSLVFMPIVYDTKHLVDTLFLLNEGWRVYLGLRPGVDFGSFYPGISAEFVSLSFHIFGTSVRALNAVPLLQILVVFPIAAAVLYRRANAHSAFAIIAVVATIILTRAPLEDQIALTDLVSAHSFSYNRLGLALSLILLTLILLPPTMQLRTEAFAGVSGGVALALAILSKWSFLLLLPMVLLALILQRRHAVTVALLLSFLICWMVLDPLGHQFFRSIAYMADSASAESNFGGLGGAAKKAIRMILWHLWPLALLGCSLWITTRALPVQRRWIWLFSLLLMGIAVGGNLLVMGSFTIVGHQIIPVIATLAVICFVINQSKEGGGIGVQKLMSLFLIFSFLLPHLTNSILVTAEAFKNQARALTSSGPMDGYLHRNVLEQSSLKRREFLESIASKVSRFGTLNTENKYLFFEDELLLSPEEQYLAFVDGIQALQGMGDLSKHGIVADGLLGFEFAVGARPVVDFPLWPRPSSPEITSFDRIPHQADIVMVLRHDAGPFGDLLVKRMGSDFRLCKTTGLWDVFVRQRNSDLVCN